VGTVTTGEPGSEAAVSNSGTPEAAVLDFTIPAGATGPANGLNAYGGLYNTVPQTLNLAIGGTTQLPLPSTMPALGPTYTPANSITIGTAGTYEINYASTLSAAIGTTVTTAVRRNGTAIPEARVSRLLAVGVGTLFNGSILIDLSAGDVIDLALSALLAVGVTLGGGVNTTLTVKKLN